MSTFYSRRLKRGPMGGIGAAIEGHLFSSISAYLIRGTDTPGLLHL